MNVNRLSGALWLATALLVPPSAGGCASDETWGNTGEDDEALYGQIAQEDVASTNINPEANPARRVEIIARDFRFTPSRMTAAPGEVINIVLRNQGTHEHSIVFDLPGGHQGPRGPVGPGRSAAFMVRMPNRPGNYFFYCPIDNHRQMGMQGVVRVMPRR